MGRDHRGYYCRGSDAKIIRWRASEYARLGRYADAGRIATGLLPVLRQPLTRFELHRLLAACAHAAASHASPHVLRYHHVMERRKEVEHRATARGEPTEPGTAAETLRRLAAREPAVVLGAAAEVRARAVAARSARPRDRVTHDEAAAAFACASRGATQATTG